MEDLDRMDSQWVEMVASQPAHVLFRGGAERLIFLVSIAVMAVTFMATTALAPMPAAGGHNGRLPYLRSAYDTPGFAQGISLLNNFAYVADEEGGLQIIDVSNPINPVWRGAFDTPGTAQGVSVVAGLAFVADGRRGLQLVDVGNPAPPLWRGAYDTPGYAYGVTVVGRLIYVADGDGGLVILRWNG
ncbi:MAG: hypothetical protein WAW26_27415 [Anaerolineae bacterium]